MTLGHSDGTSEMKGVLRDGLVLLHEMKRVRVTSGHSDGTKGVQSEGQIVHENLKHAGEYQ